MELTEVRIKLINNPRDRLRAYCTITIDSAFVVRDVKIVEGSSGLFVAMPSRKATVPCPHCRTRNPARSRFCNECGGEIPPHNTSEDGDERGKLHRDIAHPIKQDVRDMIQRTVLEAYRAERGFPEEPADEPTESVSPEPDDRPGESSEYDMLIAGLDGGGREDRTGKRPRRRPQSGGDTETRSSGETSAAPRRGGQERDRQVRQDHTVSAQESVPVDKPAETTGAQFSPTVENTPGEQAGVTDEVPFGVIDDSTGPEKSRRSRDVPPPGDEVALNDASDQDAQDHADTTSEDTSLFGAGIT